MCVYSDLTLYSLDLAPESESGATSLAVTVSAVQSHQTVPFPAKLAQNAESVYLLWKGDLLAPLAGLPADQRAQVKEVKVRVKTPTPRVVAYETPEGFDAHQQAGSATLTFTSKPGVDFSSLSEQVRLVPGTHTFSPASFRMPQAGYQHRKGSDMRGSFALLATASDCPCPLPAIRGRCRHPQARPDRRAKSLGQQPRDSGLDRSLQRRPRVSRSVRGESSAPGRHITVH